MNRQTFLLLGLALILAGIVQFVFTAILSGLELAVWHWILSFWPLIVIGLGGLIVSVPLLVSGERGLTALFIPGLPILTTGALLLVASVLGIWEIWEWLWPLEVLALALGFLLAAILGRFFWLVMPAIFIGLNGLVFQFCAITDWWEAWAVLWTVEPLAVGLSLLVVGLKKQTTWLTIIGLVICGLTGLSLVGMVTILSLWWLIGAVEAVVLISAGIILLIWRSRIAPSPWSV
jgi:hypothetical protein